MSIAFHHTAVVVTTVARLLSYNGQYYNEKGEPESTFELASVRCNENLEKGASAARGVMAPRTSQSALSSISKMLLPKPGSRKTGLLIRC